MAEWTNTGALYEAHPGSGPGHGYVYLQKFTYGGHDRERSCAEDVLLDSGTLGASQVLGRDNPSRKPRGWVKVWAVEYRAVCCLESRRKGLPSKGGRM